jgi:hypothetical protein
LGFVKNSRCRADLEFTGNGRFQTGFAWICLDLEHTKPYRNLVFGTHLGRILAKIASHRDFPESKLRICPPDCGNLGQIRKWTKSRNLKFAGLVDFRTIRSGSWENLPLGAPEPPLAGIWGKQATRIWHGICP